MNTSAPCTGVINMEMPDGSRAHVHLGMECWKCDHFWWDCTNDETVPCPHCGEPNWARTPASAETEPA